MEKKNNLVVILVAVIVLAIIVVVLLKFGTKNPQPETLSQTDIELNQAIKDDSTKSISTSLDNINVDEAILSDDLNTIDQELEKL